MKKYLIYLLPFLLSLLIINPVSAQDSIAIPDTLVGWQSSWNVDLNGSQASYSNWSQGGVNNIAATGNTTFISMYSKDRFSYGFLANFRYGKTRIEDEGVRKINDRIYIKNRFLYDLGPNSDSDFKLFGNIDLRTQIDKGYDYGSGENGDDVLISQFFAPAYFTESAGIAYIPTELFSFEVGLGLKQTIVSDESLATLYGLNEGDTFRSEAGLTIGADVTAPIAENLLYTTGISTFTNVNRAIKSTDIYFNNKLTGKINNFMNASLSLDFIFDDDFSTEIQVAQVLSLGVSFALK